MNAFAGAFFFILWIAAFGTALFITSLPFRLAILANALYLFYMGKVRFAFFNSLFAFGALFFFGPVHAMPFAGLFIIESYLAEKAADWKESRFLRLVKRLPI